MSRYREQTRLESLDAFRGFTIAGMILVNSPGSWNHIYAPLRHAEWHGWTPTDLVFPFFLFIVGVALTFSLSRQFEPTDKRPIYVKILRRAAILFALGLLLAAVPHFDLAGLRIVGVLQRIAVVYLAASVIVLETSRRTQAGITAALLLAYWAVMRLAPVPGVGAGVLTPEGNFAAWIDRFVVPGAMHRGTWDPEGFLSTFPALATALLGVFTGYWIRSGRERARIAAGMFATGWVAILAGLTWGLIFPINKNLWTSSYVLFTAGAALEGLALCYWLIDVQGYRRWARPAVVFGLNSIAAYVLSSLLASVLRMFPMGASAQDWLFEHLFASWTTPVTASMLYALSYVACWWLVMALLYRQRIFIKI